VPHRTRDGCCSARFALLAVALMPAASGTICGSPDTSRHIWLPLPTRLAIAVLGLWVALPWVVLGGVV
jgi:hypothetical protein